MFRQGYHRRGYGTLPDPVLYAGGAVDALPEQVRMAVVAGVLLDHVDVDPAEADVLLHEAAGAGQGAAGAVLAGAGDLRAPGGKGVAQGGALSPDRVGWNIRGAVRSPFGIKERGSGPRRVRRLSRRARRAPPRP